MILVMVDTEMEMTIQSSRHAVDIFVEISMQKNCYQNGNAKINNIQFTKMCKTWCQTVLLPKFWKIALLLFMNQSRRSLKVTPTEDNIKAWKIKVLYD